MEGGKKERKEKKGKERREGVRKGARQEDRKIDRKQDWQCRLVEKCLLNMYKTLGSFPNTMK